MSDKIKGFFVVLALILLMGVVGRMDYEGTYKNFCEIDEKALDVTEASK